MIKYITIIELLLCSFLAMGADDSVFKNAEKEMDEFCSTAIGSQPGLPNILNAIDILTIEAKFSSCALREQIGLTANHSLYINGFRKVTGGNEFTYTLIDFSSTKPISKDCVARSHYVQSQKNKQSGPRPAIFSSQEVFNVVCIPSLD